MTKRTVAFIAVLVLSVVLSGGLTAAGPGPVPNVTFTLVSGGPPKTMQVGETATVVVEVTSDPDFLFAQMLPTFYFPGRGVMATNMGGDRVQGGGTARLEITFVAKESTSDLPNEGACLDGGGLAPVAFVAGAHYAGGYVATQRFPAQGFYCIRVP
jgi:hypothetical protein